MMRLESDFLICSLRIRRTCGIQSIYSGTSCSTISGWARVKSGCLWLSLVAWAHHYKQDGREKNLSQFSHSYFRKTKGQSLLLRLLGNAEDSSCRRYSILIRTSHPNRGWKRFAWLDFRGPGLWRPARQSLSITHGERLIPFCVDRNGDFCGTLRRIRRRKNCLTKCANHVASFWLRHPAFQRTFRRPEKAGAGSLTSLRHRLARSPVTWSPKNLKWGCRSKRLMKMIPRSALIWTSQPRIERRLWNSLVSERSTLINEAG